MIVEVAKVAGCAPSSLGACNLLELCEEIEAMPAGTSGEFVLARTSGEPLGVVFAEHGRVCWAAAQGLSRRLSDLLATRAGLDATAIEACYATCKREGIPLGELLVGRGILLASELRAALLQHTIESLRAMFSSRPTATFRARRGGYSARFTFSTAEIVVESGRDDLAAAQLLTYFNNNGWGAAFVRGNAATPTIAALLGPYPARATDILRVGRWAASMIDLARAVEGTAPIISSRAGDSTYVALESAGVLLAGEVPPHGTARILNYRASLLRSGTRHGRV